MGMFENFTSNAGLTPEEKQARKDAKSALKERASYEQTIRFGVGKQLVGARRIFSDKMYQLANQTVIFDLDDTIFFKLLSVEFDGPRYHEEIEE